MTTTRHETTSASQKCFSISEAIVLSVGRAISAFEEKLEIDGSYGKATNDIACYFKSPMMWIAAGEPDIARKILAYIKNTFMLPNGDFGDDAETKSIKPEYIEYWSYMNGWILRAANKLEMPEISQPASQYLDQYHIGTNSGFVTANIGNDSKVSDVLTASHHGLINLESGNLETALSAGNYLCGAINNQPAIEHGFYLRIDSAGKPIIQFPAEQTPFYFVSKHEADQLHFMIGYPSAFLAMLFKNTLNEKYLVAARQYFDFSLSCHESIYACNYSHKIAWAASILLEITGEEKHLDVIEKITTHFIKNQSEDGMWYADADINTRFDQSAEIACWFMAISKNINDFKKKFVLNKNNDSPHVSHNLLWATQDISLQSLEEKPIEPKETNNKMKLN